MRHHLHASQGDELVATYLKIPLAGKITMLTVLAMISILSKPVAAGCFMFFITYGVRHGAIHGVGIGGRKLGKDSYHYRHHMLHHQKGNWGLINFSGVHPWIDKIFKTYRQS